MPYPAIARPRAAAAIAALVLVALLLLWTAPSARAAWSGDLADIRPGTPDATLAGHLTVRDGGSPEGGKVTARQLDSPDGITWSYGATVDDAGAWSVDVPAGRYALQAESRFGLATEWPDLPLALGSRPVDVATGQTRRDLDFTMRLRLPLAAHDEFGWAHGGWAAESGPVLSPIPYPRDTRRSITAVRGPAAEVGGPRLPSSVSAVHPATSEFRFAPGADVAQFEFDLTNTGDGVFWADDVRVEGAPGEFTTCGTGSLFRCPDTWIAPGGSTTFPVTVDLRGSTGPRVVTVVVANNAGPDIRIPVRFLPAETPAPTTPSARVSPVAPPATPAAVTPAAVRWGPSLRGAVVRRSSVRVRFPAAGRVLVRIDRSVRIRTRAASASAWRTVRTVRLRGARSGLRTARIARLPAGRYRVRLEATPASGARERLTAVRSVRR